MQGGFLLDVVVRERAAVLELLAGEDQALLVRGNAFLVLDLRLDVVDRVRGLNLQGDGLAGDCVRWTDVDRGCVWRGGSERTVSGGAARWRAVVAKRECEGTQLTRDRKCNNQSVSDRSTEARAAAAPR